MVIAIVATFIIAIMTSIQARGIHPLNFTKYYCGIHTHYDVIFSEDTPSTLLYEEMLSLHSPLKQVQYTYISFRKLTSFVEEFVKQRHQYGRTMLYLVPDNITQLTAYVNIVKTLYRQSLNELNFDSQLITLFKWPMKDGTIEDNYDLLHSYSKYFPFNSEVYVSDPEMLLLMEIYSFKNVTSVKKVSRVKGVHKYGECFTFPPLSQRRNNLNGVLLNLVVLNNTQGKCNAAKQNKSGNFSRGVMACDQILSHFQKTMNFSVAVILASDYITMEEEGVLGGIGKFLQTGEADASLTAVYMLDFRLKYLTALLPIGSELSMAYLLQPPPRTNIYKLPFAWSTWLAIFAIVWLLVVTSVILTSYGAGMHNEKNRLCPQNMFWIICVLCQKEWHYTPLSISGKIVLATTAYLSSVLYIAYSGAMVIGLAYEPVPISNIRDLVSQDFKLVYDPQVYDAFFQTSHSTDWITEVIKRNKLKQEFTNDSHAVLSMMKGKVAYLTTTRVFISAYFKVHQNDSYMCETVSKIPFSSRNLQSAYFIPKGSPLKEVFNSKLVSILETGLKHRFWRFYYQRNNSVECSEKIFSYRANLALVDVISAYYVLLLGILGALTLLVAERRVHAFYRMNIRKYNWANQITF